MKSEAEKRNQMTETDVKPEKGAIAPTFFFFPK